MAKIYIIRTLDLFKFLLTWKPCQVLLKYINIIRYKLVQIHLLNLLNKSTIIDTLWWH